MESVPRRRVLPVRRVWMYRLLSAILLPLALLGAAEGLLRVAGRMVPADFLVPVEGQEAYTGNPRFGWRFFPKALSRSPARLHVPAPKPDRTFRIVVLGGSAAHGTPEAAFGFGRVLEVLLREAQPDHPIEVVNAAMTAVNSHVVREIARDCLAHAPDLFVVYMGNNEVVGPYGPGTAFGGGISALPAIRARVALSTTAIGQLAARTMARRGGKDAPASWQGMEMFTDHLVPAHDARLAAARANLSANLTAICSEAHAAGIPVVLCTVAVNLFDCAPFASAHRPDLTPAALFQWKRAFDAGCAAQADGEHQLAAEAFARAVAIDDQYAELRYRLGTCLRALGRETGAWEHYRAALELDALRFRADAAVNTTIRDLGRATPGVQLVDVAAALASPPRGPDAPLFYEHVHFTFEGNYEVAHLLLPAVQTGLGIQARSPDRTRSPDAVAARLGFTSVDRYRMAAQIWDTGLRPPFTQQADHQAWQSRLRDTMQALRPDAAAIASAVATTKQALDHAPDDIDLQVQYARRLLEARRYAEAVAAWQHTVNRLPDDGDLRAGLGMALIGAGHADEAEAAFEQAVRDTHSPPDLCRMVAGAYRTYGRDEEARKWYGRGLAAAPRHAGLRNDLGVLDAAQGQLAQACAHLQKAVALAPDNAAFRDNYAAALLQQGQAAPAEPHLLRAVELDPWNVNARDRLAIVLARRGAIEDAIAHLEEAMRLSPEHPVVKQHYAELLQHRGRTASPQP